MKLITPVICELCEFDWKNGACGDCQMSREQLDAVGDLQTKLSQLENVIVEHPKWCGYKVELEAAEQRVRELEESLGRYYEDGRKMKIELDDANAKLSRYESAVRVEGTYSEICQDLSLQYGGQYRVINEGE